MSLLRWTTQMPRTSSVLLRPSSQLGSFSFTEMNQQWNFTSGFTYTRAAIVWPHVHESLFEVAVNWKVRAKRQEAFNDTRPSCGHFRVRFTLTPTGLTDPQSWKEFSSGAHLNFTRPKRQPQKRAGWRGWVGCGMGWERERVCGSCRVWWLKLNCRNGSLWREDTETVSVSCSDLRHSGFHIAFHINMPLTCRWSVSHV